MFLSFNSNRETIILSFDSTAATSPTVKKVDIQSSLSTLKGSEVHTMNIIHDIRPVTYLKSGAADLLKQINDTHRPVIITQNGEPKAVLQVPESYEHMRNAIGILKLISIGEDDLKNGNILELDAVFEKIEEKNEKVMDQDFKVIQAGSIVPDLEN